ncbi:hypothetical protein V6N13_001246 [Hibiscus sabdariffa]
MAKGDSITNMWHADLNPGVNSKSLVEFQNKVFVIPNVIPERSIRQCHYRPIPQRVVVSEISPARSNSNGSSCNCLYQHQQR